MKLVVNRNRTLRKDVPLNKISQILFTQLLLCKTQTEGLDWANNISTLLHTFWAAIFKSMTDFSKNFLCLYFNAWMKYVWALRPWLGETKGRPLSKEVSFQWEDCFLFKLLSTLVKHFSWMGVNPVMAKPVNENPKTKMVNRNLIHFTV